MVVTPLLGDLLSHGDGSQPQTSSSTYLALVYYHNCHLTGDLYAMFCQQSVADTDEHLQLLLNMTCGRDDHEVPEQLAGASIHDKNLLNRVHMQASPGTFCYASASRATSRSGRDRRRSSFPIPTRSSRCSTCRWGQRMSYSLYKSTTYAHRLTLSTWWWSTAKICQHSASNCGKEYIYDAITTKSIAASTWAMNSCRLWRSNAVVIRSSPTI